MIEDPKKRTLGLWDWEGKCAPKKGEAVTFQNFTLGCFQWTLRGPSTPAQARKNPAVHLKKGRVQHRIKGQSSDPESAVKKAKEWCAEQNAARETNHIGGK